MKAILKNACVYTNGGFERCNMLLNGAELSLFKGEVFPIDIPVFNNTAVFPGFCDVHVHFREPGFSYKETMLSGSHSAAAGGYTAVCTMPNLKPCPDTVENINVQIKAAEDSVIYVLPYASITKGQLGEELSELDALARICGGFSDDGRGVQDEDMMRRAMKKAKELGKIIVAHCEDNSLLRGGYIHDGEYARTHGHRGICSESEWGQIKRDLRLAEEIGCAYHVCHISTKESVQLIREAKARGVNVTCETAPHYLTMNDSQLQEHGRFKMNPPIRSEEDRLALVEGLIDGTVDFIATDHAPHSAEEKSRGLEGSLMGVVGLETAFPVIYTDLVRTGVVSMERVLDALCYAPRARFGINTDPGFTVFDLGEEYTVDPNEFLSMGRSTPFEGVRVSGRCLTTVYDGRVVCDRADKA